MDSDLAGLSDRRGGCGEHRGRRRRRRYSLHRVVGQYKISENVFKVFFGVHSELDQTPCTWRRVRHRRDDVGKGNLGGHQRRPDYNGSRGGGSGRPDRRCQ